MRKITKLLTLALAALMIMSAMPVSAAFTDVSAENEALADAVQLLSTLGVVKGTSETEFSPENLVTREQMAAFVYRLMKAGRSSEGGVNNTKFTDLEDSTFFNMISWANSAGIIKGTSETTFNPKGNITLQDAYVMVVRALGYEKDETLLYPFGYTDKAEELGLDEDVPSERDYTDNLTRGDVAIILANAFYADMNEKTVEYEWVDDPNNAGNSAYVAVETAQTIANKIFNVVEKTLVVTATAHNALGTTATYVEGEEDCIKGTVDGQAAEYTMEELDLEGSSDDYFLAEITLFTREVNNEEKIVAAQSNLVKKTVTAADVVIERSTKTDDKYYIGDKKNNEKVMTGLVTLGGIKAYLDYIKAPKAYTKDNATAVEFIGFSTVVYDEEEEAATFVYANNGVFTSVVDGEQTADNAFTLDFEAAYTEIYNNGLYEADVYDIDGDGYANYIFVKPYSVFQILDKKTLDFTDNAAQDSGANTLAKVYTKDALVEGAEYESEDYVLGYYGAAGQAYIKVVEVLKAETAVVSSKSIVSGKSEKITLDNGTVVDTLEPEAKIATVFDYNASDFVPGQTVTVYAKDGIVLYMPNATTGTDFDINANYALIMPESGEFTLVNADAWFKTESKFTNGEAVETYYVRALVDGAVKWVEISKTAYYQDEDAGTPETEIKSHKIKTATEAKNAVLEVANGGKFFTYTKSGDALVLKEVNFATWEAATFADTVDAKAAYGDYSAFTTTFSHYTGSIYNFNDGTNDAQFKVNADSKIIIKSYDDVADEDVYTIYTAETLPKFAATVLSDVKVVLINNTKSAIEDLAIAYADLGTGEFDAKTVKDYRIVIGSTTVATADDTVVKYSVLNIKDGTVTNDVVAANDTVYSVNDKVILNAEGEIAGEPTITTTYAQNTLFKGELTSYDEANKLLTIGATTYEVAADATILVYIDEETYFIPEENVLTEVAEEIAYEELEGAATTGLMLYVIGTNADEVGGLNVINTIVVEVIPAP